MESRGISVCLAEWGHATAGVWSYHPGDGTWYHHQSDSHVAVCVCGFPQELQISEIFLHLCNSYHAVQRRDYSNLYGRIPAARVERYVMGTDSAAGDECLLY